MPAIITRTLTPEDIGAALPALCVLLADCVEGGASVGFMSPFSAADAEPFWDGVRQSVLAGGTAVVVAEINGDIVGTVQLGLAMPPNQPHRADLKKLLVHRKARGLGVAKALMRAVEEEAAARARTLLVLDTVRGSLAETLYAGLGWQRAGVIPDYAMMPDGAVCDTVIFHRRVALNL